MQFLNKQPMITKLLFSGQSAFVNPIKIIAVETWPLRNATFEIRLTPNSSKSVTWSNRIFGAVFNTMPNRFCLLLNHYIICNVMNISKFCKIRKVKFDRRLKNCQTLKLLSGSTRNFHSPRATWLDSYEQKFQQNLWKKS